MYISLYIYYSETCLPRIPLLNLTK